MAVGPTRCSTACWLVLILSVRLVHAEFVVPLYDFVSRPDIRTPRLQVTTYDAAAVAPGYLFLTPWCPEETSGTNFNYGPVIYDNSGDLVWTGYNPERPHLDGSMGFFVCQYGGKPHIAYSQGGNPGLIHGDILDEHYNRVQRVTIGETSINKYDDLFRDMHEFNVITPRTLAVPSSDLEMAHEKGWVQSTDPESAIVVAITIRPVDPPAKICGLAVKWIRDFPFQEVSLDGRNTVLFEWNPMDHIPLEETEMCPGMMDHPSGTPWLQGSDQWHPFDFVHRNSVDKLPDGDFLMSARHMNTIYKISHIDGSIIWRLGGGRKTDFNQTSAVPGISMDFAFQHDVRVVNNITGADPANGIIGLTLWDNANARYDGKDAHSNQSMGKTIIVDQSKMVATLVSAFSLPRDLLGTNQGSHQALPNKNHIIGGGNIAQVVEYAGPKSSELVPQAQSTISGHQYAKPVFTASFGGGPMNSYRVRRFDWHGYPAQSPDVIAYRQSCLGYNRTFVYVSWNGATEVAAWNVLGISEEEPFRQLASSRRTGFETVIPINPRHVEEQVFRVYAVALDQTGKELGRSETVHVWVPREQDRVLPARVNKRLGRGKANPHSGECNERRCHRGFEYAQHRAQQCHNSSLLPT